MKIVIVILIVFAVVGLALLDRHITAARNTADKEHLQNVKLGMAEADAVRTMGVQPIVMGQDPREKEMFVWERTTVLDSLLHWNQSAVGKTITVQDGRVVNIRDDMIIR